MRALTLYHILNQGPPRNLTLPYMKHHEIQYYRIASFRFPSKSRKTYLGKDEKAKLEIVSVFT